MKILHGLAVVTGLWLAQQAPQYDLLSACGTVVDGTGAVIGNVRRVRKSPTGRRNVKTIFVGDDTSIPLMLTAGPGAAKNSSSPKKMSRKKVPAYGFATDG